MEPLSAPSRSSGLSSGRFCCTASLLRPGQFEIIKDSIGALTANRNLQALLIAFAFGAFLEGAAGFGTPVAVSAAILGGLGFPPFYAAGICLLANTAPVAFGSIAIPLVTLAATTGLPIDALSRDVGRLCAPVSLIIPAYLILVMGGRSALRSVWPGAVLCGVTFAGVQFFVSNFVGPYLTDILSSVATMLVLMILLRFWAPPGERPPTITHTRGAILRAWLPYLLLVVFVLSWSIGPVKALLEQATLVIPLAGLASRCNLPHAPAGGSRNSLWFRRASFRFAASGSVLHKSAKLQSTLRINCVGPLSASSASWHWPSS